MCGIAGYVGEGSEDIVRRMAQTVAHRGPDGIHVWLHQTHAVGLAQARLAIIDLSHSADQPMTDASGRYTAIFNGEIYNFAELKKELPNYSFKTHGDTE